MGRIKKVIIYLAFSAVITGLTTSSLNAEQTEEYKESFTQYKLKYQFISMVDSFYTVESELGFPDGYHNNDSSKITDYANWISNFPIWHMWKPVGSWKGPKLYDKSEISRVVHLPWTGMVYKDFAFPIRILAEYYIYKSEQMNFQIQPKLGEAISYKKWLVSKPLFNARGEIFFKSDAEKENTEVEFYKMMSFGMHNIDYASLANNCDTVTENSIEPGDMYIANSGRKGKALLILNVVQNSAGEKLYVFATGCPDACDFHIPLIKNDRNNPWVSLEQIKEFAGENFPGRFYRFKLVNK